MTGFDGEQRRRLVWGLRSRHPDLLATLGAHVESVDVLGQQGSELELAHYVAIADAVDFTLGGLEIGESAAETLPFRSRLGVQWAARENVPVATVLGRYHACQVKLADLLMAEIERSDVVQQRVALGMILEVHALNGRFTTQIAEEYAQEAARAAGSPNGSRTKRAEQLLRGESLDVSGLGYELEHNWHVGAVAVGPGAGDVAKAVARAAGCELLSLSYPGDRVNAWWGDSRRMGVSELRGVIASTRTAGVMLALGEPGAGLEGWRLTHRQAAAALRVARRGRGPVTTFSDVGILAPWMLDPALARSFVETHLAFMSDHKDEGLIARETLTEYFKAGHHVAAAASALKVDRGTLRRRLAAMESQLGCVLAARQAELEVAMRLEPLLEGNTENLISAECET